MIFRVCKPFSSKICKENDESFNVDSSLKIVTGLVLCGWEFVNYVALVFFSHLKTVDHNSPAIASELLCMFHAALLWRQIRWAMSALLGAEWTYPDGFLEGPGQGAPPLLQWASEVQPYGPVAPAALYRAGWSKTALCRYQHIFGLFSKLPSKVYFFLSPVVSLVLNLEPEMLCVEVTGGLVRVAAMLNSKLTKTRLRGTEIQFVCYRFVTCVPIIDPSVAYFCYSQPNFC